MITQVSIFAFTCRTEEMFMHSNLPKKYIMLCTKKVVASWFKVPDIIVLGYLWGIDSLLGYTPHYYLCQKRMCRFPCPFGCLVSLNARIGVRPTLVQRLESWST
mmetsp:Transcript_2607/g.4063  ORF Transcript_2607/g.4063 Transcript_2607/m.4063 type:complete len:104 (+) Transcript_2607:1198-1509(+)